MAKNKDKVIKEFHRLTRSMGLDAVFNGSHVVLRLSRPVTIQVMESPEKGYYNVFYNTPHNNRLSWHLQADSGSELLFKMKRNQVFNQKVIYAVLS